MKVSGRKKVYLHWLSVGGRMSMYEDQLEKEGSLALMVSEKKHVPL